MSPTEPQYPSPAEIIPATAMASSPPAAVLDDLARRAAGYARQTSSESTRVAYAKDWKNFENWCRAMNLDPLPATPATIGVYLTALAGRLAVATLTRRLAAISTMHRLSGHALDTRSSAIHDLMRGVRREHGARQRRVAPATTALVVAMAGSCDDTLLGLRDRALLLIGFASAMRRSELVALDVADVELVAEGLRITIRRSKTDQDGAGEVVGIVRTGTPTCPVKALQRWLETAQIEGGRVFRAVNRHGRIGEMLTGQSVALVIKKRAKMIGLVEADFAGHSLRAGLATAAATNGVDERTIMRQTRHVGVTVRRYIRDGEMFVGNASGRVGL